MVLKPQWEQWIQKAPIRLLSLCWDKIVISVGEWWNSCNSQKKRFCDKYRLHMIWSLGVNSDNKEYW